MFFLNFGNKNLKFKSPITSGRVIISTSLKNNQIEKEIIYLNPQEGIVII